MARRSRRPPPRLMARPLQPGERRALAAALAKAGLAGDDLESPDHLFWRYETADDVPVGFGGLEIHGEDSLMRSVVTLPPMRRRGIGAVIIALIEVEAAFRRCRTIWALTEEADFFERLGYATCDRSVVPQAIRDRPAFASSEPGGKVLMKRLG